MTRVPVHSEALKLRADVPSGKRSESKRRKIRLEVEVNPRTGERSLLKAEESILGNAR
jgi:hypothetical protein